MRNLHLHKWSKWSEVLINYNGKKCQYRYCTICNKADFRLWWDGQVSIIDTTNSIITLKEGEK